MTIIIAISAKQQYEIHPDGPTIRSLWKLAERRKKPVHECILDLLKSIPADDTAPSVPGSP